MAVTHLADQGSPWSQNQTWKHTYPSIDEMVKFFDQHGPDEVRIADDEVRNCPFENAQSLAVFLDQICIVTDEILPPNSPQSTDKWKRFRARNALFDEVVKVLGRPSVQVNILVWSDFTYNPKVKPSQGHSVALGTETNTQAVSILPSPDTVMLFANSVNTKLRFNIFVFTSLHS